MTTTRTYDSMNDRVAALLQSTIDTLGPELVANPQLGEVLNRYIDQQVAKLASAGNGKPPPPDGGLTDLIGYSPTAPLDLGDTVVSPGVVEYDDTLPSRLVLGAADLYYFHMHERLGVFRVMAKLLEQFEAGTLRIGGGLGATGLYRYGKHGIVRYKRRERLQAYARVFGYAKVDSGARPNLMFHGLFRHFIGETAKYWRDKRISEVIRERAQDPTFGSIAIVRRAALDLRNNVKKSSYGNVDVMRIELSQMLAEAFAVLQAPDLMAQFGAQTAWDMIELVLWQYFHESVQASTMNRMAVAGRDILRWLAEPFVLNRDRTDFETTLFRIAESAEEWISSDEGMRSGTVTPPPRQVFATRNMLGARRAPLSYASSRSAVGPSRFSLNRKNGVIPKHLHEQHRALFVVHHDREVVFILVTS